MRFANSVRRSPSSFNATMTFTETSAIVAEDIQMVFQSQAGRFQILKGIDLTVRQGDVHLLMGPSGSGKTTLLQILSGLLTPTAGKVHLLDTEITALSRRQLARFRLHHIGFIAQDFNLFPALTAAENILLALTLKGIRGKEAQAQTRVLLEQINLQDRANHLPRQLSGGQQQRVSIARALAGDPALVMADEPTAALDSQSGQAVMALLRQLVQEKGCTVLMVTHDPRVINFADRISHLEDGEIIDAKPVNTSTNSIIP
ncbi:ABC transporter ATP-binding protein [Phormidium tenue FACHB-886]|nr:ABC transporter ATP-binding protein [Phormidium tenue FACHB-886]